VLDRVEGKVTDGLETIQLEPGQMSASADHGKDGSSYNTELVARLTTIEP